MPKPPDVRTGQGPGQLTHAEFAARFRRRFFDPAFGSHEAAIEELLAVAWEAYRHSRKSPQTRPAGPGFADPGYELSIEWLGAKAAVDQARQRQGDPQGPSRVLLVCGAARNDKTCPGEMSKTFRMLQIARCVFADQSFEADVLDLSLLVSEYGKSIYPCKGCVSTAMPLCHWPCSCYPNHSLGQVSDCMNDIYPRWVAAHGIMIITPVYWYQAPTVLKAMIDRLVCADGGNPDPSSTHGKTVAEAKALELRGWAYPRHLAGRSYSIIVHGDAAGAETLRRSLCDWLDDMDLIRAGTASCIDRYIDYYGKYATSHDAFDADAALHGEIRNAALALCQHIRQRRAGTAPPDADLSEPRPK